MTFGDSEIQNDIDSWIAKNRFDARRPNPKFACAVLGIFRNDVSTAHDLELWKSGFEVRGTDVARANDSNVFGSWFEHFWKQEYRRQKSEGRGNSQNRNSSRSHLSGTQELPRLLTPGSSEF